MAAELLTSAHGIMPVYEYLLQGSITDKSSETLLQRLEGLTDFQARGRESFIEHEAVFSLQNHEGKSPFTVRVRKSLDYPNQPVHMRYLGTDTADKNKQTIIRSCIEVSVSQNLDKFLQALGFTMKVTVSKICRMKQPPSTAKENLEQITPSQLVELSILSTTGQDQIQEDMRTFADQLKPLVSLEKVDHGRLVLGM